MNIGILPLIIFAFGILIIVGAFLFTRHIGVICSLAGIFVVAAIGTLVFIGVFDQNSQVTSVGKKYDIIEESLATSGRSGTPVYVISYKDSDKDAITVTRCSTAMITDENSYIAWCRFEYAGFYRERFVYYKNIMEVDDGEHIGS